MVTAEGRMVDRPVAGYPKHRQDAPLAGLDDQGRRTPSDILKNAALHKATLDD